MTICTSYDIIKTDFSKRIIHVPLQSSSHWQMQYVEQVQLLNLGPIFDESNQNTISV